MQCMGTDYCQLPVAGEYGAVYRECGRSAEYGEYIDTGLSLPVVQVHPALCCQNRKHPGTGGGKIGVLLCR